MSNPQDILGLLRNIQVQIQTYQPTGETAGSVRISYMEAADILDRIAENINLAYIMENGGFLVPTAQWGQ